MLHAMLWKWAVAWLLIMLCAVLVCFLNWAVEQWAERKPPPE